MRVYARFAFLLTLWLAGGGCRWWAVTGLGARGLVYHGWLGRIVAEAIAADDDSLLPPELLRWKS